MEVEILKEAVEYGQSRKWIAHAALLPKVGEKHRSAAPWVCRVRSKRSADWQDRRCHQRNDEADAEILSDIAHAYGKDLEVICKMLGHRSTEHTHAYLGIIQAKVDALRTKYSTEIKKNCTHLK